MRSQHLSVVIAASARQTYEFAAEPENLHLWAAGLADSTVTAEGDLLRVSSPMGEVTVRFVPRNPYGVLDHQVTLPDETTVTNPMRVLDHPEGSEVLFTVRQLDLTDEAFERDASRVQEDLHTLKTLVERATL